MKPGFYVVRTYCWTDKKQLWKVLTRPLKDRISADDWMDFEKEQIDKKKKNPKHKFEFFVVEIK